MGGVQRQWQRSDRYARKGQHTGTVGDMTEGERAALISHVNRDPKHEAERLERIEYLKSLRPSRKAS